MKTVRIIPRLDIKGPNVVKGIHLEGLRVLGKPEDFARVYYEEGADELLFMDVVASLYERNSLHNIISETAKKMFIPLTVGGGLRSIDDIRSVLRAGADKVCLNTAAINNPDLVKEASRIFGSSTIVVAIEAIKEPDGRYLAYTDNGREYTGIEVKDWAVKAESYGAGEIILTSVDKEGTGEGFDINLLKTVSESIGIPVVAHGGAGKSEDVSELFMSTEIEAVSIASLLHYDLIKRYDFESSELEGNNSFLKEKRSFHNFKSVGLKDLKNSLIKDGIACRTIQ